MQTRTDVETPSALPGYLSYNDIMEILWRRKSLLMFGLTLALVLGALYYVQKKPEYESVSQVLVVHKRPETVTGERGTASHVEDYGSTHRILVKSPIIVQRAVDENNLGELDCLQNLEQDVVTEIIEEMTVSQVAREAEGVMEVSYVTTDAQASQTILNAILASYKDFLDETYRDMSQDTVKLIEESRDVLENDLRRKESEYHEFRKNSTLLSMGRDGAFNPSMERLSIIGQQRSEVTMRKAELAGRIRTVEKAQAGNVSANELASIVSKLASTESVGRQQAPNDNSRLQAEMLPLLAEEKRLINQFGDRHPAVVSIRERIEAARNFLVLPNAAYEAVADDESRAVLLVKSWLEKSRSELQQLQEFEKELGSVYEEEYRLARDFSMEELREEQFRSDIKRSEETYDGLIKRLHQAGLVKDFGGFQARIIAPATIGEKVAPRKIHVLAGVAFLGLLTGGALIFFAELRDRSFHTAEEIHNSLGLPIFGHVPTFDEMQLRPGDPIQDSRLCTYWDPKSIAAEAYRTVRTALYFSEGRNGDKAEVVQITSPNPGDGKSTLISNLATGIARSGRRVLLIDADLRKPRQHNIFGVSAETGLSTVISDGIEPFQAIQSTIIENLSIMPAGPIPPDPAELLTKPEFSALIPFVRDKFDYVLIDTAPVLAVTDPSIVSAQVDGTIVAMRINHDSKDQADRTIELLSSVNGNVLGVVVNGVGGGDTKYYRYQKYAYGYGVEDAKPAIGVGV